MRIIAETSCGTLQIAKSSCGTYDVYIDSEPRQAELTPDELVDYMVHIVEGLQYGRTNKRDHL